MSDDLTVLGVDGIRRSFDEHYDTMMEVEQDPTGAHHAIQNQHARIEELEAKNRRLRLEAAHANDTADAAIEQTKELEEMLMSATLDGYDMAKNEYRSHIGELEAENKKLHKAIEIYERERTRFKHAKPEMTGEFFIAGCHGSKDNNLMPQFIEVCPAYGAGWVMIYENTGRTISYEGS